MTIIITDSTALFHTTDHGIEGLEVVPLGVNVEGTAYKENVDLDQETLSQMLVEGAKASSSQPSAGEYLEKYQSYPDEEILVVSLSSLLSGTYESAMTARQNDEKPERITVFDGRTIAGPQQYMTLRALEMAREGATATEIVQVLEGIRYNNITIVALDNIDFLRRGGRMSDDAATDESLNRAIPLLKIADDGGRLDKLGVKIGWNGAVSAMAKAVCEAAAGRPWIVYILGDRRDAELDELESAVRKRMPDVEIRRAANDPVMLSHMGPGSLLIQGVLAE